MKTNPSKLLIATLAGGLGIWIPAVFLHNLILPDENKSVAAHHKGIDIFLMGYFILAFIMSYIYSLICKVGKPLIKGLKIGISMAIL